MPVEEECLSPYKRAKVADVDATKEHKDRFFVATQSSVLYHPPLSIMFQPELQRRYSGKDEYLMKVIPEYNIRHELHIAETLEKVDPKREYFLYAETASHVELSQEQAKAMENKLHANINEATLSGCVIPYGGKRYDLYVKKHVRDWRQMVRHMKRFLEAVAMLKRVKLVHRDLTQNNIIGDGQHRLRIIDFGVAAPFPLEDVTVDSMTKLYNHLCLEGIGRFAEWSLEMNAVHDGASELNYSYDSFKAWILKSYDEWTPPFVRAHGKEIGKELDKSLKEWFDLGRRFKSMVYEDASKQKLNLKDYEQLAALLQNVDQYMLAQTVVRQMDMLFEKPMHERVWNDYKCGRRKLEHGDFTKYEDPFDRFSGESAQKRRAIERTTYFQQPELYIRFRTLLASMLHPCLSQRPGFDTVVSSVDAIQSECLNE